MDPIIETNLMPVQAALRFHASGRHYPDFCILFPPKKMLMFPYNGKTVYLDAA